jgi:hypothetical protein
VEGRARPGPKLLQLKHRGQPLNLDQPDANPSFPFQKPGKDCCSLAGSPSLKDMYGNHLLMDLPGVEINPDAQVHQALF